MVKHILCNYEFKFNSAAFNSYQKWKSDKCQYEYKRYLMCNLDYGWNSSTFISEYSKYLKSIVDDLVIVWQMWQIIYQKISQALCQ